jgi:hypothetical protein
LENAALRKYYGLESKLEGGVLVTHVNECGSCDGLLFCGDVLLSIGHTFIATDATVQLRTLERVHFVHEMSRFQVGDACELTILRNREKMTLTVQLKAPAYIVSRMQSLQPVYFIFAGFVFTTLTVEYMATFTASGKTKDAASARHASGIPLLFSELAVGSTKTRPQQREVCVLVSVLAATINRGYQTCKDMVVDRINEEDINEFADIERAFSKVVDFHVVELRHANLGTQIENISKIVIDASKAQTATQKILKIHKVDGIKSQSNNSEIRPATK